MIICLSATYAGGTYLVKGMVPMEALAWTLPSAAAGAALGAIVMHRPRPPFSSDSISP